MNIAKAVLSNLQDRVDGLLGIMVTDSDGTTHIKQNQAEVAFAAAYHMAAEQAAKLQQLGGNDYLVAEFDDFVLVQFSTQVNAAVNPFQAEANASPSAFDLATSPPLSKYTEQQQQQQQDVIFYVSIFTQVNANTQSLLDMAPYIKSLCKV